MSTNIQQNPSKSTPTPQSQPADLLQTLTQFYKQSRNPSSEKVNEIQRKFNECQKKIIKVVEHRKDLQNTLQNWDVHQKYEQKLLEMNRKIVGYEEKINQLIENLHQKQNYILQLEVQISSCRVKMAEFRRLEAGENRQIRTIRDGLGEMKGLVGGFIKEISMCTNQGQHSIQKTDRAGDDVDILDKQQRKIKDSIRTRQMLLDNRVKLIKVKQQMLQISQATTSKYIQSLRQSIKTYQTLYKSKSTQPPQSIPTTATITTTTSPSLQQLLTQLSQINIYEKSLLSLQQKYEIKQKQINKQYILEEGLNCTIMQLQTKILNLSEEGKQKDRVIEGLKEELDVVRGKVREEREEGERIREMERMMRNKQQQYTIKINNLKQRYQTSQKHLQTQQTTSKTLQKSIKSHQHQQKTLHQQSLTLQQHLQALKQKNKTLQTTLLAQKQQKNNEKQKYLQLMSLYNQIKQEKQLLQSQIESVKMCYQEMQREFEDLRRRYEEVRRRRGDFRGEGNVDMGGLKGKMDRQLQSCDYSKLQAALEGQINHDWQECTNQFSTIFEQMRTLLLNSNKMKPSPAPSTNIQPQLIE